MISAEEPKLKIVVGVSGASGAIYGVRLLEKLRLQSGVEVHLILAPCSIHTMSAIAGGISSNLLIRAADVTLKERRPLILMVRESPLHLGHLRTMTSLSEMGAIIAP